MLDQIREFFGDPNIDEEWLLDHISVELTDINRDVTITVDRINWQEYQWLKEEI